MPEPTDIEKMEEALKILRHVALEALVYPWLIPLAYRVARVWDHLRQWRPVYVFFASCAALFWLFAIIEEATRG